MTEKEQKASWKNFREWVATALNVFLAPDGLVATDETIDTFAQILECRAKELARAEGSPQGWQDKLRAKLTCRNGYAHYCPNCDNSIGPDLVAPPAPGSAEEGR